MSTATQANSRSAVTDAELAPVLRERWSPRSFDPTAEVSQASLHNLLEAARWSPSAMNTQPWRFIVARRGSETFTQIHSALLGFNQEWADKASVLIVAAAQTENSEGKAQPWAQYDLGQSVAALTVQASAENLYVHQMAGFDADVLNDTFEWPSNVSPMTVIAVGHLAAPEALSDVLAQRETAPRERKAQDEIVLLQD